MNINTKIILLVIGSCLLSGVGVSIYSFNLSEKYLIDSRIQKEENKLKIISETIVSNLVELENDVQFLASTPPIKGMMRASLNNGVDPLDNSSIKSWRDRLSIIFQEMLYAKENYSQIRFISISNNGKEIVRVDRRNLKVERVEQADLQDKSNESYYKEIIRLDPGKTYLSDFSFNREFGKISYPLEMVIRAAKPVFINNSTPFGFIIINENYTSVFKEVELFADRDSELIVVSDDERVLYSSESSGFVTAEKEDENSQSFEFKKNILSLIKGKKWDKSKSREIAFFSDESNLYLKRKLFYNKADRSHSLTLVSKVNKLLLQQQIYHDLSVVMILLFLITSVAVLIAFISSSRILGPLRRLNEFTMSIAGGANINFEDVHNLPHDEVGQITKTIANLSKDILSKNHQLISQQAALDSFAIVAETDIKGKISYVNTKFIEISKYSKAELIGNDHRMINSGHHPKEFFEELWRKISSGHIWRGEIKNRAKDGSFYWVDTTIFPVLDENNTLSKYVAIRYDVTDRKKFEEELTREKENAQHAMEVKSTFLANMSHEIRTPLNGIMGFTSMLLDSNLDEHTRQNINYIKSCSDGLLTIINDILDLSKMEAGKLLIDKVPVNIKHEVESALKIFDVTASKRRIDILFDFDSNIPEWVLADGIRIRQVLVNLVGNAIKFSPENEKVEVAVRKKMDLDNELILEFSVSDNGIGIDKKVQDRLFDSFEQADISTTRQFGGTGLGLSICKKLTELMEGEIWVNSEIGFGAKFYFTVKVTETSPVDKVISTLELENFKEFNIKALVVDDNDLNTKIAAGFLKKIGIEEVTAASNGKEAIEILKGKEHQFNIIFMDIQMPVMDGIETTKKIREELNSNIPIVGLSANAFEDDRIKAINSGMNYYLVKPLKKLSLLKILNKMFKQN